MYISGVQFQIAVWDCSMPVVQFQIAATNILFIIIFIAIIIIL